MTTVYKYQLNGSCGEMMIPRGVEIICVDRDWQGIFCVWAIVDSENIPKEKDQVFIVGTGSEVPRCVQHIGTIMERPFVWHVFIQS